MTAEFVPAHWLWTGMRGPRGSKERVNMILKRQGKPRQLTESFDQGAGPKFETWNQGMEKLFNERTSQKQDVK